MNYIQEGPHMGHVMKAGPEFPHKKDKNSEKMGGMRKVHPMFEAHRYHPGVPSYQGAYGHPHPMGHPMGYPGYGAPGGYMGYDSHHAVRDQERKPFNKFDSTMLLGNENDANYLEKFMNDKTSPKYGKHLDTKTKHRNKSVTTPPTFERTSAPASERTSAPASDEEIYESMEIINHRKTLEAITKRDQTAKIKKTRHPLFDHLPLEKAIKEYSESATRQTHSLPRERALSPQGRDRGMSLQRNGLSPDQSVWPTVGPLSKHPARRGDVHTSDGNSSGSGDDEFDYTPRPNHRFSRSAVLKTPQGDSDDDWGIPLPSFGSGDRTRRSGATGVKHQRQGSTDESDSSSKSTRLR
jgi:hypothetical protein